MDLVVEHLLLHLRIVHRAIAAAVRRRNEITAETVAPEVDDLGASGEACVSQRDAELLLDHVDRRVRANGAATPSFALDAVESAVDAMLRERAAKADIQFPLDALAQLGIDEGECLALLTCVAVEIDPGYELLFGFIVDDLTRRFPSVELVCALASNDVRATFALRRKLSASGRLRRFGLLVGDDEGPTERHRGLRISPLALDYLRTGRGDPVTMFRDREAVDVPTERRPVGVPRAHVAEVATRLGTLVDTVGIWGTALSGRISVVESLAATSRRPLRRLRGEPALALRVARDLDAVLWIDVDRLDEAQERSLLSALMATPAIVCLVASTPWRPLELLAERRYVELELTELHHQDRAALWSETMPELAEDRAAALATRLRLAPERMHAAIDLARRGASLRSNGVAVDPASLLAPALAAVTRTASSGFTTLIDARRSPDELVLPPAVHRAVMEVARFYRAHARVGDAWKMDRLVTGGGGVKALFTGDSGTGKTMAAEVIAFDLGLPLLRVDLGKIVSKWVGETERNLEAAFAEAEATQAILFFDEADSLFGKRGQVQRGSDRYANLEVSYLLQRLEDYAGVAMLATNLRDNIDKAFTRRFDVLVHFPRPGACQRETIWRHALATAPLESDVDVDVLGGLDMTGAAIVSSARTAALMAADAGDRVGMRHLVRAVARQFHHEARILTPRELGPFASMLGGAA